MKLKEYIEEQFPEIAYRFVSSINMGKNEWSLFFKDFDHEEFERFYTKILKKVKNDD